MDGVELWEGFSELCIKATDRWIEGSNIGCLADSAVPWRSGGAMGKEELRPSSNPV